MEKRQDKFVERVADHFSQRVDFVVVHAFDNFVPSYGIWQLRFAVPGSRFKIGKPL